MESPLPPPPQIPPIVRSSYGIMFVAGTEVVALWSVLCLQVFMYYSSYPKDPLILKAMVSLALLIATAHMMMTLASNFGAFITHFGDIAPYFNVNPLVLFLLLPTTLIALMVQSFFIWRIWIFGQKRYFLPCILGFAELFQLAGNIFTLYKGTHVVAVSDLFAVDHVMLAYYAVSASADLTISICMIYLLSHHTNESRRFKRTARVLHRLIVLSINSGLWTAIFAIGVLILSVVYVNELVYSILYFPLAQLYANSFLANLNARNYLRNQSGKSNTTMTGTGTAVTELFRLDRTGATRDTGATQIFVSTSTTKNVDDERHDLESEFK